MQTARNDRGLNVVCEGSWIIDPGLPVIGAPSTRVFQDLINPHTWPLRFFPRACISPLPPPRPHQHPFVTPGVRFGWSYQVDVSLNGRERRERRITHTVRRSSASCKMRSYIGVFWLLVTLLTSLGFVDASGPFIQAPGRKFTLDGE